MTSENMNFKELTSKILDRPDSQLSQNEIHVLNSLGKTKYSSMKQDLEAHTFDLKDTSGGLIKGISLKDLVEHMDTKKNVSVIDGKTIVIGRGTELGAWIQIYLVAHPEVSLQLTSASKAEYLGIDGKIGEKTKLALNELQKDILSRKNQERIDKAYPYLSKNTPTGGAKSFQTQNPSYLDVTTSRPSEKSLFQPSDVSKSFVSNTPKPSPQQSVKKARIVPNLVQPQSPLEIKTDSFPRAPIDVKDTIFLQAALEAQKDAAKSFNVVVDSLKKPPEFVDTLGKKEIKPRMVTKIETIKPRGPDIKIDIDGSRDQKLQIKPTKIALEDKVSEAIVPNKKEFIQKVLEVANNLKINPSRLMLAIHKETGGTFDHQEPGKASNAYGLIQFMPDTINGLLSKEAQYNNVYIDALLRNEYPHFSLDYIDSSLKRKYGISRFNEKTEEEKNLLRTQKQEELVTKYTSFDMIENNQQLLSDMRKYKRIEIFKTFSNIQQLDYVEKYLRNYARQIKSYEDIYSAIFYPEILGKPDSHEVKQKNAAKSNSSLHVVHDNILTAGEVRATAREYKSKHYRG